MNDFNVIMLPLPASVSGFTKLTDDGFPFYTIVLNSNKSYTDIARTYMHEVEHIRNGDYDRLDVDDIENIRHIF